MQYQLSKEITQFSAREATVLLPVFNGIPYITEAIDSILGQTFTNFELLVIDDGSTDDTLTILQSFAAKDPRVRVISRENRGLIATLNQGISLSNTELIVRMDADDIALPTRLERQIVFMKSHPDIAVCGTGITLYETGENRYLPEKNDALRVLALFNTPVFHPTVIMRKSSVLKLGGYSYDSPCAEDYDLWERMLHSGSKLANLGEVLLMYRIHPNINRSQYYTKMTATSLNICCRQLKRLGLPTTPSSLALHRICCAPCPETPRMHARVIDWLHRIEKANLNKKLYPQEILNYELALRKQKFFLINPFRQPIAWTARTLRHFTHYLLSLISHDSSSLEGRLASCWWHIKKLLQHQKFFLVLIC